MNDLLSMPLGILLMMALTVMPIKIAADLFGAENNQIKHCAIALTLEVLAAILLIVSVGGFSAVMLIFVAASAIYWIVLKISFSCSLSSQSLYVSFSLGCFSCWRNFLR